MKIINPSVEIITEPKPLKRIELCGRVCYKSEDRITGESAIAFAERIIKSGHTSVLEHSRIIVDSPYELKEINRRVKRQAKHFDSALHHTVARMGMYAIGFFTLNVRDYLVFFPEERLAEIDAHENATDYMTVRFICDRGIANELVRHRVFSFSQESTRYVSYKDGVTFIRPLPFEWAEEDKGWNHRYSTWIHTMGQIEKMYQELIDSGCTPQEARNVLPLSTKTELLMTGTHQQWTDMLKLRLDRAAHPQMRYLMKLLVENELFPGNKIQVPEVAG